MLKINENQIIKMSKGDDAKFPLFLNRGSTVEPIRYLLNKGDGCEIYFYILNTHGDILVKKIFKTSGEIETYVLGVKQPDTFYNNINENGDLMLRLMHDDTVNLDSGLYKYQIKAKLVDLTEPELPSGDTNYVYMTVTNKIDFYLLDDNYGDRSW